MVLQMLCFLKNLKFNSMLFFHCFILYIIFPLWIANYIIFWCPLQNFKQSIFLLPSYFVKISFGTFCRYLEVVINNESDRFHASSWNAAASDPEIQQLVQSFNNHWNSPYGWVGTQNRNCTFNYDYMEVKQHVSNYPTYNRAIYRRRSQELSEVIPYRAEFTSKCLVDINVRKVVERSHMSCSIHSIQPKRWTLWSVPGTIKVLPWGMVVENRSERYSFANEG